MLPENVVWVGVQNLTKQPETLHAESLPQIMPKHQNWAMDSSCNSTCRTANPLVGSTCAARNVQKYTRAPARGTRLLKHPVRAHIAGTQEVHDGAVQSTSPMSYQRMSRSFVYRLSGRSKLCACLCDVPCPAKCALDELFNRLGAHSNPCLFVPKKEKQPASMLAISKVHCRCLVCTSLSQLSGHFCLLAA